MEKKNLQPQQQKPVVRQSVAKPIAGLSEEQLTAGWSGASDGAAPSINKCNYYGSFCCEEGPFAGDDAE